MEEMWGKCRGDVGEMWGRDRGEIGEMWGRDVGDVGEMWGRDVGEMARWTRCATSRGGRCGGGGDRTCAPTRGRFGGDVGESLARRPLRRREHSREPRRELTREWPRSGAVVRSGNDFDLIVNTLAAVFIVDIPALAYKATLPRHFRDTSETLAYKVLLRHVRDASETRPRHVRDIFETLPRHFRSTLTRTMTPQHTHTAHTHTRARAVHQRAPCLARLMRRTPFVQTWSPRGLPGPAPTTSCVGGRLPYLTLPSLP